MAKWFALVVMLLVSCSVKENKVETPRTILEINNAAESAGYTVFPCTLENASWTFSIMYPEVAIERSFKAEDACRRELEVFTKTNRGELERCHAANLSEDCLTFTAVKMNDSDLCKYYSPISSVKECEQKVGTDKKTIPD